MSVQSQFEREEEDIHVAGGIRPREIKRMIIILSGSVESRHTKANSEGRASTRRGDEHHGDYLAVFTCEKLADVKPVTLATCAGYSRNLPDSSSRISDRPAQKFTKCGQTEEQ